MKKVIFLFFYFTTFSYGDVYGDFYNYVNKQKYVSACKIGQKIISLNERDEKFLSVVGEICLKADYIDTGATIQSRLRKTKEARINAVILSSVLLQKRLIYQFMYDNTDISTLALPVSDHPLSHTFVAIRDGKYKLISKKPKIIKFERNNATYKVYIDFNDRGRIVIEITNKNKKTIHRYL